MNLVASPVRRASALVALLALPLAMLLAAAPARAAEDVENTAPRKKIVLVAGKPSHAPGEHEFRAGVLLLQKCLAENVPGVEAKAYFNGWPDEPDAFADADSIVLYMDGGGGHPVIQMNRLKEIGERMAAGAGLVCIHYAVEVPADRGGPEFLDWIGGFYETGFSTNPHWDAALKLGADSPILNGVNAKRIRDEWYYNIRFREDASSVKTILSGTPPDPTRRTDAAKAHPGREETLAWSVERPDGGRGFGFTGAHFHKNWGDDDFRRLILNAIVWTARGEVPEGGVPSVVTAEDLAKNLDPKGK